MSDEKSCSGSAESRAFGRRGFLVRTIATIHAAIGATLAFILGGAALAPAFTRRQDAWLRASTLDNLRDGEPVPITLRVTRQDGFTQVVDRTVVYLVKTSDNQVRAMHSTCTHLGCRTSYDAESKQIVCPCHGGVYDIDGQVVAGPPPAPLPQLNARVEDGTVFVQI
jgi:quinol---cytochrome c reductase iron-sulfur subunit, bacillus type